MQTEEAARFPAQKAPTLAAPPPMLLISFAFYACGRVSARTKDADVSPLLTYPCLGFCYQVGIG